MGLLKFIAIGAAVAYGVSYITKKRDTDGRSIVDDLSESAPDWADNFKKYGEEALSKVSNTVRDNRF